MEDEADRTPETMGVLAREKVALLTAFLTQSAYTEIRAPEDLFSLSAEAISELALSDQAHYYFFQGVMLQQKKDYGQAVEVLEQALARENHPEHSAAILHELAKCYLQMHSPQTALIYAVRAHHYINTQTPFPAHSTLPFQIELDAAFIFLTLNLYQSALEHFERARTLLHAQQPMHYVSQLYWGLGYALYGLASLSEVGNYEIERLYHQGLGYLVQSRTVAQMCSEKLEEKNARLVQARLQLDWCIWRRQRYQQGQAEHLPSGRLGWASLSSFLDEASEQCRQVLASFDKTGSTAKEPDHVDLESWYSALALLIRIGVQRALLAYEQGYESTFQRECSLIAALGQQLLDACADRTLLETISWHASDPMGGAASSSSPALPRLPEHPSQGREEKPAQLSTGQAEVYFAAGEIAELFGQTASSQEFLRDSYQRADACFQRALEGLQPTFQHQDAFSLSLAQAYQRYTSLVEERLNKDSALEPEDYPPAGLLLALCKQNFQYLQESPFLH